MIMVPECVCACVVGVQKGEVRTKQILRNVDCGLNYHGEYAERPNASFLLSPTSLTQYVFLTLFLLGEKKVALKRKKKMFFTESISPKTEPTCQHSIP